jgi:hypothetical protein
MSFLVSLRPILALLVSAVATATIVPNIRADMLESATAGTNVTLMANADGNPAPTFKWLKDGVQIAGATSPTLVIQNVTLASNGVYNAVASNAAGWAMSEDVILKVVPQGTPPFFTVQPYPSSVAPANSVLTLSELGAHPERNRHRNPGADLSVA